MFRFINEERTNILINSLNELLNNYRVRNNSFNLSLLNDNSENIYSSILETETTETETTETETTETYSTGTFSPRYPFENYYFFNDFVDNQRNNILYDELENSIVNSLEFSDKKYKKVISDNGKKELKKLQFKKNDDNYKNDICPIIQTEFDDNEIITQLPCKHCFNPEAITHWLEKEKAECPICRFELDYDEIKIEDQYQDQEQEQDQEQDQDQDQEQEQEQENVIPMIYNMDIDRYMEQLTGVGPDNNLIDSLITSRTNLFESFTRTYSDPLTILMNNENQDADFQEALFASLN
jgi:hypothetical protein